MILGVDIGGTNICFGLAENGKLVRLESVPSFFREATLEDTLTYLSEQIERFVPAGLERIGIGVPSVVDLKQGVVYDTVNIPSWQEVPLKAYLEDRFHIPVAINNDANCFTMGAYGMYPADEKPEVLVGITLGTGVGIGIVDRGRLFCGATCGAGELGSLPYDGGMLEDACSKKFYATRGWEGPVAARCAREGDPAALAFFEELGRNLGAMLCTVLYAYDPSHIAFGGGGAWNYPLFCASMEAYAHDHFPYRKALERLSVDVFTGNEIPVLGATLI